MSSRGLHPIVVRRARLERAGPRKGHCVERGIVVGRDRGHAVGHAAEVGVEQRAQGVALTVVEFAAGHALGRCGIRDHLVVGVGVYRSVMDGVAGPLELVLLGGVGEPPIPPDARERDHPVPFADLGR
jgi:hypothetical protein